MTLKIPVAHDFICPWCWVGFIQATRLEREFGVTFDWLGFELLPLNLEWPEYSSTPPPPNKPKVLSRFEFLLAADELEMPVATKPKQMRTYNAHQAVEFAKSEGVGFELVSALYEAYWRRGENINDLGTLAKLATGIVSEPDAMVGAVRSGLYKNAIVGFDDPAYAVGIYNVPTFFIGDNRYAEQPYAVLRKAVRAELALADGGSVYAGIEFPPAPEDRPYTFVDMVSTIDGKILSGTRDDHVLDLGSKVDHRIMNRIEAAADAILIGGQTLRSAPLSWQPKSKIRVVVSGSGNLPAEAAFFCEEGAIVAVGASAKLSDSIHAQELRSESETVDLKGLLERLKGEYGVQRLLVLGGSELNAQLLGADLVDELFVTIAPKVKLGRDVPTYAGGEPLPREHLQGYKLIEHHAIGDEVFIRYRRTASGA